MPPDHRVVIGTDSIVDPTAVLDASSGPITIGQRCHIHHGALLLPYDGSITMGDDCTVNPYTVLYGHGHLKIGNGVRIATHTVFVPANHVFADPDVPIHRQGRTQEGIEIEDDVWIGCNVSILDGVRIGTGSVVAAGSVVTHDVEPYSVVAGVPAKTIRRRS